jgi:hypothetical protein
MDGKHKGKRVVGWYHTHPGFGIFLSDRDQFIQNSFFNLPFQIAFVYDPKSREHGVFTWHDNAARRARRYWIGDREQVWDGARAVAERESRKDKPAAPGHVVAQRGELGDKSVARDDSLGGSLGSLAVLGVFLLVAGGFIGHWFGSGSAAQMVAEARSELDAARLDGAQKQLALLQSDLVGVLRTTLGDEAVLRPVGQAIDELDRVLAVLPPAGAPLPVPVPSASPPAALTASPVPVLPASPLPVLTASPVPVLPSSPVPSIAGTAAVPPPTPPGAGSAAAAPPAASVGDPRLIRLAAVLRDVRDELRKVGSGRGTAAAALTSLERLTRRDGELRADLGHDVAEQRSALGALYSELAADAIKAGDAARVRRLLATAAHVDPGNRTRYEKQLQSFDTTASLPRDEADAGQEPHR